MSHLDGVPFDINEKYKPPKKLELPRWAIKKLKNKTEFEEYDFSFERSVLNRVNKLEEISLKRKEKQSKREERIKSLIEEAQKEKIEAAESEVTLLQPVPINPVSDLLTQPKIETRKEGQINLSDFENDTSSPFDYVELKTINEMEELAHVLGSPNINYPPQYNYSQNGPVNGFVNQNWSVNNYGYVSNPMYTSSPITSPRLSSPFMTNFRQPSASNLSNTASAHSLPPSPPLSYPTSQRSSNAENESEKEHRNEEIETLLRLRKDLLDRKAAAIHAEIALQQKSIASTSKEVNSLERDLGKLNEQERNLSIKLTEMGFPQARTVKAIQKFGMDEAKIIEHLLQVNALVEKQYPERQVEKALELKFKEEDTIKYLENVLQIMKLGFDEDDIADALAKTCNDRDKALDMLIS